MLAAAAFFVAAILFGSGLARLPWLGPLGVSLTRLPRWDILCFQHVFVVVVEAALPAALLAAVVFLVLCLFLLLLFVRVVGAKSEVLGGKNEDPSFAVSGVQER